MNNSVIDANIEVHTKMAATYDSYEPHFRPENQAKVMRRLTDIRTCAPGGRLLDLGCGTGFMIQLAVGLFDDICGVDVTQAMLDRVDTSSGKVRVHKAPAEDVPFDDESFDVVTAYSFLHHTVDYSKVINEAFRVLKPNGLLYIDLEPNLHFWKAMECLARNKHTELSPMVQKEVNSVLHTDAQVEQDYGIPQDTFRKAEFTKAILGGISGDKLENHCISAGFRNCSVTPDWFLGQGTIMHGTSSSAAETIHEYLSQLGSMSLHLYKYLYCICQK